MKWFKPICIIIIAVLIEILLLNHMFCLAILSPYKNIAADSFTDTEIQLQNSPWICNMVINVKSETTDGWQYTVIFEDENNEKIGEKTGKVYSGIIKVFPQCRAKTITIHCNTSDIKQDINVEINRTVPVFSISRIIAMIAIYYLAVWLFGFQSMPDYKKYMRNQEE